MNTAILHTHVPADVLRQAKAEAATRGISLRDYVTEALRLASDQRFIDERKARMQEETNQ
jgi:hypothetical protein